MSCVKSQLAACLLLAGATFASSDTLYLKNGMYIIVGKAQEKEGKIEYWVGSTKYAIAKGAVDHIEPGNGPVKGPISGSGMVQDLTRRDTAGRASTHEKLELPTPQGPNHTEEYWSALRSRITTGDNVDNMRLAEIERENDSRATANAFFLAGVMEMQRGQVDQANGHFDAPSRLPPISPISYSGMPSLSLHSAGMPMLPMS